MSSHFSGTTKAPELRPLSRRKFCSTAAAVGLALGSSPAIAKVSDNVIRVGVLGDMSGPWVDLAGPYSVVAAQMAADEVGGSIRGKRIEVISADHQNKPDIGLAIAREWYGSKGVDVVVDVPVSSVAIGVENIARDNRKIVLFSSAGSSEISGKNCNPYSFQWTYDTYALAHGDGSALVKKGFDTWYFITPDNAFGNDLERETTGVITRLGGKVVGGVKFPLSNQDFSSFLFTAQASKAKIIAITAGNWAAAVRQANEFGITAAGQKVTGLYVNLSDVKALGLKAAQGLTFVDAWYWDLNAETRAWSQRFFERTKRMPNSTHVGVYSAVRHYLKAITQAGTDDATAVAATMRALPVNDVMSKNAQVRPDGRVVRDFYLFEAKSPAESHGDWDLYKLISTIPAADVMRPLTESECPLVNARAQ